MKNILDKVQNSANKMLAVLIDPDKTERIEDTLKACIQNKADLIFVGGSLLHRGNTQATVNYIKKHSDIPVVIFPGSTFQLCDEADAILFLSLISGRNADLLIGKHVEAAPLLRNSFVEIIPTGYLLIDSGKPTTASYISNTFPIPYDKPEIAACTALAGKFLGLKCMYLDGGSGAAKPVSAQMIAMVKSETGLPLIVGGGIRTAEQARECWNAGADIVVVGTAIEEGVKLFKNEPQHISQ